jgi:hypothetical protein
MREAGKIALVEQVELQRACWPTFSPISTRRTISICSADSDGGLTSLRSDVPAVAYAPA